MTRRFISYKEFGQSRNYIQITELESNQRKQSGIPLLEKAVPICRERKN